MTQTGTQTAIQPAASLPEIVRHIVHELRQPLGGIESLAYYFELALEDADEDLREQCQRLRRLVAQAGWMLEDAALAAAAPAPEAEPANLNALVLELGQQLAGCEQRSLRLALDPAAPRVQVQSALLRRWLDHALAFFRDLAGGEPMPQIQTALEGGGAWLRVRSRVDCDECLRSLDPPGGAGGLRRVAELADGRFQCVIRGGEVTAGMWLPIVHDPLD